MKTALFYEMESELDWSNRALVQRFLGVLRRLEMSLDDEYLPHYFIWEINLLPTMTSDSMRNMRDRIKRIRTSQLKS